MHTAAPPTSDPCAGTWRAGEDRRRACSALHDPRPARLRERQLRGRAPRSTRCGRGRATAVTRSLTAEMPTPPGCVRSSAAHFGAAARDVPGVQRHRGQCHRADQRCCRAGVPSSPRTTAHINTDEAGAPGAGDRSQAAHRAHPRRQADPRPGGPRGMRAGGDEHRAQPLAVSITQDHRTGHPLHARGDPRCLPTTPTQHGMAVHMDGAAAVERGRGTRRAVPRVHHRRGGRRPQPRRHQERPARRGGGGGARLLLGGARSAATGDRPADGWCTCGSSTMQLASKMRFASAQLLEPVR